MSVSESPHSAPEPHRKKRRIHTDEKMLLDRINKASSDKPNAPRLPVYSIEHERHQPADETKPSSSQQLIQPLRGCQFYVKLAFRLLCWSYLLFAGGIIMATHLWGQSNVTLAALMYTPPAPWMIPGLIILLPVLIFDWKSGLCLMACLTGFFLYHLDFQVRAPEPLARIKTLDMIRVLTWNRGQAKKASLSALKKDLRPDFILLQDARLNNYTGNPDYAEFRAIQAVSEFVILSRWPVLGVTPIYNRTSKTPGERPWGMRCVVIAAGQRCVIYNFHLPTPRDALESYMRGSFLWGIFGLIPGSPWQEKREHYESFWKPYLDFAQQMQQQIGAETGPVIVVGDFNTPPVGPIHRQLTAGLQDAHITAGGGFGYTFPGDTNNPLALFQPWLRLDRIHVSKHWQPLHSSVHEMPAQHLPVLAELLLLPPDHAPLQP